MKVSKPQSSPLLSDCRSNIERRSVLRGIGAIGSASLLAAPRLARSQAAAQLVIYSSTQPDIQKRLSDAFTAKTGIQVQSLRLITAQIAQRFLAEQHAKQYVCDIVTNASSAFFDQCSSDGLISSLDDVPGIEAIPPDWRSGKDYFIMSAQGFSIGYNSNTVTGASIPVVWQDVLKPEFTNQIIIPDPRGDDTLVPFWGMLRKAFGDDFLKRFAQQKAGLVSATAQGLEQMVAGDVKLVLPCLKAAVYPFQTSGAPAAITPIPSPSSPTNNYTAIVARAPHKDAAIKWMQYVCSREGQQVLCKDLLISPLPDIPGALKAPAQLVQDNLPEAIREKNEIFDLLGLPA